LLASISLEAKVSLELLAAGLALGTINEEWLKPKHVIRCRTQFGPLEAKK
jgi:hypothetical protein